MKRYAEYEESGVEWIGEIPQGWKTCKLKMLAKVRFSNIDKKTNDGELPVFLCNYTDVYYNEQIKPDFNFMTATAPADKISDFTLQKGDVLITKDSETADDIAVPAFVPQSLPGVVCGYHLALIRPTNGFADGNYLFRSFISNGIRDQFEVSANGITRFGIGKYAIDNSMFLCPPLKDQEKITKYLDHKTHLIDTLIQKKQKQIELLQEQRVAIINQAVTKGLDPNAKMKDTGIEWLGEVPEHWSLKPIKHCTKINREALPENTDPNFTFKYIDIGNVSQNGLSNPPKEMSFSEAPSRARRIVAKGDTIVSTVRTYLKAIHYISNNSIDTIVSTGFATLSPQNKIDAKLLFYSISNQKVVDTICRYSVGVSYPAINSSELGTITIPFSNDIDDQKQLARYLDHKTHLIDTLIEKKQKQIDLLQEYRTTLISEVVTGKIDVRDEVIP